MNCVVIIPTYNEKENIRILVEKLAKVFKSLSEDRMRILVVDDSSPDGTGEVVGELVKKNPEQIYLLSRPKKEGLGAAYVAGMNYAIDRLGAEVVFELDGDLSHDPTLIPHFLAEIQKGADLVIGSRYIPGGSIPDDWGLKRRLISRIGNQGIRWLLNHRGIHEWSSGYRAFRAGVFEAVKNDLGRYSGYTFQVAFLHRVIHLGAPVVEIPLNFVDRRYGKSKFPTANYISNTFVYVVKERFKEITGTVFFKFAVVGLVGFLINSAALEIFVRLGLLPSLATALGAEVAIISNFTWNNWWTFSHVKLELSQIPGKFVQFNLTSSGAVVIQYLILKSGELYFGVAQFKSQASPGLPLARYQVFFIMAVILGLIWNFFFYSQVIWNTRQAKGTKDTPVRKDRFQNG